MIAAGIEYQEAGRGHPPIVCLHGIGGNTASFAPQLLGLSDQSRVIAWNMPGFGASEALSNVTFPVLSETLVSFLDALGIAQAHLCGQSIGGMLALESVCLFPDRVASLALIGTTAAFGGRDDSFKDAFLAARLQPLDEGLTLPDLAKSFVPEIVGPIASDEAQASAIASMSAVPVDTYRAIVRCLTTFNRRDDIARIEQPTCLIAGSHDQNAPAKTMARMAEKMPNARYHLVEGAGHLINLEAGEETNRILGEFYGSLA